MERNVIRASVCETEEYEVSIGAGDLAGKLGVSTEDILAAVEQGEGDLYDGISEWIAENYAGSYGVNTGNGDVEVNDVEAGQS